MSEQPTAEAAPPKKPAGKKTLGLTRQQLYIAGGVFVAALVYIVWKRRQSAAQAASGTAGSAGSNECTDANGNPVDCGELTAEELAALQNSLDQLGANSAGSGGGGSAGGGGTGTTPVTDGGTGATGTPQPTGTGTTASTGTATATATAWAYPAPGNLKVTSQAKTGVYLTWNGVKGPSGQTPSSYTVATYDSSGKEVNQHSTVAGSTQTAEFGPGGKGLKKGSYHTNVWANGGPKAPPHATVSYTLSG